MKKLRGFKLGGRLVRVFKCIIRSRRRKPTTARPTAGGSLNPVSRILALARNLRLRTCQRSNRGYIKLGQAKPVEVPKGHLVVYVGESNGDTRREVVPVIYINHPLFGELLKDTERVYGYNHSGGIQIPCEYSEFEKVKTRIASWGNCHNATWKQRKY